LFWTEQSLAWRNQKDAAMHDEKNLMDLLAKWKIMRAARTVSLRGRRDNEHRTKTRF
jgi:hypothetical protein